MGANVYENNNGRLPIAPAYMSLACLEYLPAGRSPVYQLFLKVLVCETGAWVHECLSDKESNNCGKCRDPFGKHSAAVRIELEWHTTILTLTACRFWLQLV